MIPHTFLYDEYIGRPNFTEQKKPFEYIVPPPTSGVGTKMRFERTRKHEDELRVIDIPLFFTCP